MFKKNLEALDNASLKRRLERVSPIESRIGVSYCVTPSGDYVLLKNDLPTEDLIDPRGAIKKMLANTIKSQMKSNDIIIGFGMGLAYLLDELFNTYPSKIFIYEPDLNLLHFVFNNVDFSEHLASGRVFITNELDELVSKLSSTFLTKDKVEIVYLQNYAVAKNKELLMLTQKVYDTCKSKAVDVNTIVKFSKVWLMNTIENMAAVNKGQVYKLSDLENKFIGQTALIVAAGPSLNDNITKIQENRDKFVIFAVNKAVRYLLQNGVTPDFVVCLDARNMQKTLGGLEGYLNKSNCIMDVRSDKTLMNIGFDKVFLNFADTDFFIQKLAKYNDFIRFYESGGSASTLALTAAVKMGFTKIVLSGLDLAFKDNVIYANGETMERISQEKIRVDAVEKQLVRVKSVTGMAVYTREDYEAFIHHFAALIKDFGHKGVYNTTSFGAFIPGVNNVSFDELGLSQVVTKAPLNSVEPIKFDLQEFMQDEFRHINSIISMLSKGTFSTALVNSIIKSVFIYQYLQLDVLNVLQKNFDSSLAEGFMDKTKLAIKSVVEELQKSKLI